MEKELVLQAQGCGSACTGRDSVLPIFHALLKALQLNTESRGEGPLWRNKEKEKKSLAVALTTSKAITIFSQKALFEGNEQEQAPGQEQEKWLSELISNLR